MGTSLLFNLCCIKMDTVNRTRAEWDQSGTPGGIIDCGRVGLTEFPDVVKGKSKAKDISILSLNIRSLKSNFNEFCDLLTYLQNAGHLFSIICVQEVRNIEHFHAKLDGYNFIKKTRERSNGGGVGIFIREELDFSEIPEASLFTERKH